MRRKFPAGGKNNPPAGIFLKKVLDKAKTV